MKVLDVSQSRLQWAPATSNQNKSAPATSNQPNEQAVQWAAYGPRHGDEPMDLPACLGYRGKVGSNPQIMF
jgi:hypothetical protein